jgi:hypothetical protein
LLLGEKRCGAGERAETDERGGNGCCAESSHTER